MKQEDKELLLKDLCARLPYGVIGEYSWKGRKSYNRELTGNLYDELESSWNSTGDSKFLPYLHPMSSMTKEEFTELKNYTELKYDQLELVDWDNTHRTIEFYLEEIPHYCVIKVFDWLNAHHFDYRNLIGKGLALVAPDGMYNIKEKNND